MDPFSACPIGSYYCSCVGMSVVVLRRQRALSDYVSISQKGDAVVYTFSHVITCSTAGFKKFQVVGLP
jgi:hypothetical protein